MTRCPNAVVRGAAWSVGVGALALALAAGAALAVPPSGPYEKPGLFDAAVAEVGGARLFFGAGGDLAFPARGKVRFLDPAATPESATAPAEQRARRFQGTEDWQCLRVGERLMHIRQPGATTSFWKLNFVTGWVFAVEGGAFDGSGGPGKVSKLPFRCSFLREGFSPTGPAFTAGLQCPRPTPKKTGSD